MSATAPATSRLGRGHQLSEQERNEWKRLRETARRGGRTFSKADYIELLQTENMDLLRANGSLDRSFIFRKFPGMPSVTPSSGSDRSNSSSSDSSPSTSAENSPVDLARERRFDFPSRASGSAPVDENRPTQERSSIPVAHRKRMTQIATPSSLNDLRSAFPDDDEPRPRKHRRDSDDVMPVLMVNAPVPPPPRLLQPDGGHVLEASADEHDFLAQLADQMFPDGLEEEDDDNDQEPPVLANNVPQPSNRANTGKVPLAMRDSTKVKTHYVGAMNRKCSKCSALFYPNEAIRAADGSYGPCCASGAVSLPTTYDDFPLSVYELLKWEHPLSADFHRHVRNYNSSLSFASINCNMDRRVTGPGGPYCFRIHGNVYTLFNNGTLTEGIPSYAQLYVVDSAQATDYRMQHPANDGIDRDLLQALDDELRRVNPHAQSYQMLREVEEEQMRHEREQAEVLRGMRMEVEEPELPSFKLLFKLPRDVDRRRYNIPRANEIAAVFRTNADGSIPPAELIAKGLCTKKFPKAFLEETRLEEDGYPLYRRRQDGREFVYGSGQNQRRADNRWVVPYCPALLKKYNCHMNVEIVQGIRAVKYLYKYIFKGFDRAYLEIAPTDSVLEWDEIAQHMDARYVSSSEACSRLLKKPMHGRTHAVVRLHVHKPGQTPTAEELADADDPVVGDPELDEEAVGEAYDNMIQVDPVEQPANVNDPAAQPVMGNALAPPMSDDEGDGEAAAPAGGNVASSSNRTVAPPSKSTLLA